MPTLADYMMQRDQTQDKASRYSLEAQPTPEWANRLGRAAAGGADYMANALLNPQSKMDILRLIDQNPQIANWITMNLTPPGQMIQGSLDVNDAIHSDAPWQNRLAQGAAGVLGMATAPLGVDTKLAGSAARGLNRIDELARSGELTRQLQNEYGAIGKLSDIKKQAMSVDDKLLKDAPWRQGQIEGYVDDPVQRQKNFDEWFGDSKVVDENGKPLTVEHQTDDNFESFSAKYLGKNTNDEYINISKLGHFFSDPGEYSPKYMEFKQSIPTNLKIENPYILDRYGTSDLLSHIKENGGIRKFKKMLKDDGYDGIILEDYYDGTAQGNQYIAFDPSQIKSIFNRGTYSKKDPRILYGALPLAAMGQDDNDPVLSNAPWRQQQ